MNKDLQSLHLLACQRWFTEVVLKYNLCPFAHEVHANATIRWAYCPGDNDTALLQSVHNELLYLNENPSTQTSLLLMPHFIDDFVDFYDFVCALEERLDALSLLDIYQLAVFHPKHLHEAQVERESTIHRAPLPLLHILRSADIEVVTPNGDEGEAIVTRNNALFSSLSQLEFEGVINHCRKFESEG